MHAGSLRRQYDSLGVDFVKAGDILRDRAIEELNILGEVADVGTQRHAIPLGDIGAIQANTAELTRPNAQCHTRKRRLAGGAGPHDGDVLALGDGQVDIAQGGQLLSRRRRRDSLKRKTPFRFGKRHMRLFSRDRRQQLFETCLGGASPRKPLPAINHLIDRRQRAAHQNRPRNHHTGRQVAPQHQISP